MFSRRTIVLAMLSGTTVAICGAQAADASAQAFVEAIYATYKGKDAKGAPLDKDATIRRYFEPALARLMIRDAAAAKKRGEVPSLDGDPFIDAQDFEIESFNIAVRDVAANKASATVTFKNLGEDKRVELDLVKLKAGWRIADIKFADGRTLRGLYRKK